MRITIKDECRKPEVITDFACDPKFTAWHEAHRKEIAGTYPFCLKAQPTACENPYVLVQATGGQEEDPCDAIMRRFLEDTKPRVARDSEWDASWYLRDRSCIEKLEASPASVLETLAEARWDWESRRSTYKDGTAEHSNGYGMSTVAMLVEALADSPRADNAALAEIRAKAAASDIRFGLEDGSRWVARTVPAVIDAYRRCERSGDRGPFGKIAATFAKALADRGIGARADQEAAASALRKAAAAACGGSARGASSGSK
jgi:hypothetical protein